MLEYYIRCFYCWEDFGKSKYFESLEALGHHVRSAHPEKGKVVPKLPDKESDDTVIDSEWEHGTGWFLGEELPEMIRVNRQAKPGQGTATQRGVQFLGLKHITAKGGHVAKIIKVTTDKPDNFGNPYVVYFQMDGTKYSKGFKETSPNLIDLVDMFGEDESKWKGKSVLVNKAQDEDGTERLTFAHTPKAS